MSGRRLELAGAALLALLLVLGYLPARRGDFQFDDAQNIAENPAVRDLDGALAGFWRQMGGAGRPLTDITFAADYRLSGLDPAAFHTTSLLIHLLAVALAFLFARATLRHAGRERADGLALAAAGLWGLHPLLTQAVSYIVQRAEALASLLYLGALLLFLAAYRLGRRPAGAALYAGGAVAFFLALQAKLIAVTLPAALLLHLAVFQTEPAGTPARRRWASRLAATLPLLGASAAAGISAMRGLEGHADAGFGVVAVTPAEYLLSQLRAVLRYLTLVVWPAGQNLDYDFPPSRSLLAPPSTLLAGLILAGLVAGAAWLLVRSRRPGRDPGTALVERLAAFGLAWFLLVLSPTSSFVPVADLIFEHRAYLASLGVVLALAAAGEWLLSRWLRPQVAGWALPALALAGWGLLSGLLHARNQVWASPLSLWADVVEKAPMKARGHYNYGHALSMAGREEAAIVQYNLASVLMGQDTVDQYRVARNMGASLVAVGRADQAIAVLSRALVGDPTSAEINNNLALAWKVKGDLARAEDHIRRAIHFSPGYAQAHNTLGEIRVMRRDLPGALASFLTASQLAPDLPPPVNNIAVVQEALGQLPAACATWQRFGQIRGGEYAGKAAFEQARLRCGAGR